MILVTVSAQFARENLDQAVETLQDLQGSTRGQADCQAYDVCTDPRSAGRVFIHQVWDNMAAFDAYRQSDGFAQMGAALKPIMVAAPETLIYDVNQVA